LSGHDIIVIGASAGGVEALRTLVHALPAHFPASVFVVLHIPAHKPSALPTLLCQAGPLRALHPIDHALIEQERIYVAPPDCHLLVEVGRVHLSKGLKEKGTRPVSPICPAAHWRLSLSIISCHCPALRPCWSALWPLMTKLRPSFNRKGLRLFSRKPCPMLEEHRQQVA